MQADTNKLTLQANLLRIILDLKNQPCLNAIIKHIQLAKQMLEIYDLTDKDVYHINALSDIVRLLETGVYSDNVHSDVKRMLEDKDSHWDMYNSFIAWTEKDTWLRILEKLIKKLGGPDLSKITNTIIRTPYDTMKELDQAMIGYIDKYTQILKKYTLDKSLIERVNKINSEFSTAK